MRAAEYRARAEEMTKCAGAAQGDAERQEYLRLARAWTILAEGAERGLKPDGPCKPSEDS